MRLSLSLLFMLVFASGALAREAPDATDETCTLFAAVLEWRMYYSREIFLNDRIIYQTAHDDGHGARGIYIRKRRRERYPQFYLMNDGKIVGEALVKTWSAFELAALKSANQPMLCTPEDFSPTSVAVFSSISGIVRRAGGELESFSADRDLFLYDVFAPSRGLGPQWAFGQPGVAASGLEAVVFATNSCGALCGDGSHYLLRREALGAPWQVIGMAHDWVN